MLRWLLLLSWTLLPWVATAQTPPENASVPFEGTTVALVAPDGLVVAPSERFLQNHPEVQVPAANELLAVYRGAEATTTVALVEGLRHVTTMDAALLERIKQQLLHSAAPRERVLAEANASLHQRALELVRHPSGADVSSRVTGMTGTQVIAQTPMALAMGFDLGVAVTTEGKTVTLTRPGALIFMPLRGRMLYLNYYGAYDTPVTDATFQRSVVRWLDAMLAANGLATP